MILLLGGGLPALAVAHFGFCSGTSDACRHSAALSLSHFLSREQRSAYLPFFSLHLFLKFWAVVIIFLTGKALVDRAWTEQRNTVKCDRQCIYYHCSRWFVGSLKLRWSSKTWSWVIVIVFLLSSVTERVYSFRWFRIVCSTLSITIIWTSQLSWN